MGKEDFEVNQTGTRKILNERDLKIEELKTAMRSAMGSIMQDSCADTPSDVLGRHLKHAYNTLEAALNER